MAASLRLRASSSSFGADVKTLLGGITDVCCMKRVEFQGQEGSDSTICKLQRHRTKWQNHSSPFWRRFQRKQLVLCNCKIRAVQTAVNFAAIDMHLVKDYTRGTITRPNDMPTDIATARACLHTDIRQIWGSADHIHVHTRHAQGPGR